MKSIKEKVENWDNFRNRLEALVESEGIAELLGMNSKVVARYIVRVLWALNLSKTKEENDQD